MLSIFVVSPDNHSVEVVLFLSIYSVLYQLNIRIIGYDFFVMIEQIKEIPWIK